MADAAQDVVDELREMFQRVQVAKAKRIGYVVVDPSVLEVVEGTDGLGKLYLRIPPSALAGTPLANMAQTPAGVAEGDEAAPAGQVWGIPVYRRQDLPRTWPVPLGTDRQATIEEAERQLRAEAADAAGAPSFFGGLELVEDPSLPDDVITLQRRPGQEVSGSGYRRVSIPAPSMEQLGESARLSGAALARFKEALLRGEICTRPHWRGEWDEQYAWRAGRAEAFDDFRRELERQSEDPYREGPFDRVWCGFDRRRPELKFGLQFGDRTVEGALHPDLVDWQRAQGMALESMVEKLWEAVAASTPFDPE